MRRGTILIVGLLMAGTAIPSTAEARPLILKMFRQLTSPLGMIVGGGRHAGRRVHHSRRAVASRPRPAATAATAAAAGTAGAAATAANAKWNDKPTDATVAEAPATSTAEPNTTGSAPANEATQDAAPRPEPPQRNAALTSSDDETQARGSESHPLGPARAQTHLGKVGPLAWPTAYEDVIGYTLWPKEYGERLRTHGIGDVVGSAFAPAASLAARTEPNKTKQARADDSAPVVSACGSVDLTASDWPMAQISSAIDLTAAQHDALERFKTALNDAVASIKSTCRDNASLPPVERLRAMQNTLWAVHDAAQLIRTPLAAFYDALDDKQKQTFAAPASPQSGNRAPSRSEMARMCGLPASAEGPMRQIEKGLNPTKAQRASLDALQKKTSEMGQFLLASCLKPMPATPPERLDAAADRLTAVIFAASNVNVALNDFTSRLNDEQKAKLNAMVR